MNNYLSLSPLVLDLLKERAASYLGVASSSLCCEIKEKVIEYDSKPFSFSLRNTSKVGYLLDYSDYDSYSGYDSTSETCIFLNIKGRDFVSMTAKNKVGAFFDEVIGEQFSGFSYFYMLYLEFRTL